MSEEKKEEKKKRKTSVLRDTGIGKMTRDELAAMVNSVNTAEEFQAKYGKSVAFSLDDAKYICQHDFNMSMLRGLVVPAGWSKTAIYEMLTNTEAPKADSPSITHKVQCIADSPQHNA